MKFDENFDHFPPLDICIKTRNCFKQKHIWSYLSLAHFPMLLTVTVLLSGDSNGQAISPFHDIPLFANAEVGNTFNSH